MNCDKLFNKRQVPYTGKYVILLIEIHFRKLLNIRGKITLLTISRAKKYRFSSVNKANLNLYFFFVIIYVYVVYLSSFSKKIFSIDPVTFKNSL